MRQISTISNGDPGEFYVRECKTYSGQLSTMQSAVLFESQWCLRHEMFVPRRTVDLRRMLVFLIAVLFFNTAGAVVIEPKDATKYLNKNIRGFEFDGFGFLWIGTEDGLWRHNGHDIRSYNFIELFGDISSQNRVRFMCRGSAKGEVLIELANRNIYRAWKDSLCPSLGEDYRQDSTIVAKASEWFNQLVDGPFFIQVNESSSLAYERGVVRYTLKLEGKAKKVVGESRFFVNFKGGYLLLNSEHQFYWVTSKKVYVFDLPEPVIKDKHYRNIMFFQNGNHFFLGVNKKLYKLFFDEKEEKFSYVLFTDQFLKRNYSGHISYSEREDVVTTYSVTNGFGLVRLGYQSAESVKLLKTEGDYAIIGINSRGEILRHNGDVITQDGERKGKLEFIEKDPKQGYWEYKSGLLIQSLGYLYLVNDSLKRQKTLTDFKDVVDLVIDDKLMIYWIDKKGVLRKRRDIGGRIDPLNDINQRLGGAAVFIKKLNDGIVVITSVGGVWFMDKIGKLRRIGEFRELALTRDVVQIGDHYLFATYGCGLLAISAIKPLQLLSFSQFKLVQNLRLSCFIQKEKSLLITSDKGLIEVKIADISAGLKTNKLKNVPFFNFGLEGGVFDVEFNGGCTPCYYKDKSMLLMPSISGIIRVDLSKFKRTTSVFEVFLRPAQESVKNTGDSSYVIQCSSNTREYRIPVESSYFGAEGNFYLTIEHNGELHYANGDWRNGEIVLSVDEDGDNHYLLTFFTIDQRKVIRVIINNPSPWYLNILYISPILISFLGIYMFINRMRLKRVRKDNLRLNQLVLKKAEEIKKGYKEIEEKNKRLKQLIDHKNNVIMIINHDLIGPMKISSFVLEESMNTQSGDLLTQSLLKLRKSFSQITEDTQRLLQLLVSENEELRVNITNFDLNALIVSVIDKYDGIYVNKRIEFFAPEDVHVMSDVDILSICISNLIENSLKYTSDNHVGVYAYREKGRVKIVVANLAEDLSRKDYERIRQLPVKTGIVIRSRLGLYTSNNLIGIIGGYLRFSMKRKRFYAVITLFDPPSGN